MPTLNELKEKIDRMIINEGGDSHIAYSLWSKDDVIGLDPENELSIKQVDDVLDNVQDSFDASIGINWDALHESIFFITERDYK